MILENFSKIVLRKFGIIELKYYPIALLLIIVLFSALVYYFLISTKIATQNKLYGMAKETAHQIGTPLSSLDRLG
jgi:hypothetical protein